MVPPIIIVTDQDTATREILGDILIEEGYQVVCAAQSSEAAALVLQHQPHVLLLDVHLPTIRKDGLSLIKQLRTLVPAAKLPIVVTSTDDLFLQENAEALRLLGCERLVKPFQLEELVACIERVINVSRLHCPPQTHLSWESHVDNRF